MKYYTYLWIYGMSFLVGGAKSICNSQKINLSAMIDPTFLAIPPLIGVGLGFCHELDMYADKEQDVGETIQMSAVSLKNALIKGGLGSIVFETIGYGVLGLVGELVNSYK